MYEPLSLLVTVTDNSTGSHSIYTVFEGLQVMFHVSTMLPHSQHDSQQVEKKRHIGNGTFYKFNF